MQKIEVKKEELIKLYIEKDLSQKEVSNKLNISPTTVSNRIRKYGITKNGPDIEKIRKLHEEERKTHKEIAEELDYSVVHIGRLISENGIKKPPKFWKYRKEIKRLYVEEKYDLRDIRDYYEQDVSLPTIIARLREQNVDLRHSNDYRKTIDEWKPSYNSDACDLIEDYGKKHGYEFQHAENGGEYRIKNLGYWVDGYDEEKNVVVEADEPHHYRNGELRKKDKRRQKQIMNELGCKFIRLKLNRKSKLINVSKYEKLR